MPCDFCGVHIPGGPFGHWGPEGTVTGHEARWIRWYEWLPDDVRIKGGRWGFVDFARVHETCWATYCRRARGGL
jgi:hypothetical protein